jgi:N-acetylneuraminic acid mutarotase
MLDHERFLELAAASIDFELSPSEATELDRHLAGCGSCRLAMQAMRDDARAIMSLPVRAMPLDRSEDVLAGALTVRRQTGTLRLALVAAVLALVAVGGLAVGAQIVRNFLDNRVVTLPRPTALPSVEPTQEPSIPPTAPTETVAPFGWSSGGDLIIGRSDHAAALLADGRVLATGGHDGSLVATASTELREPATGQWSKGPDLMTARELHAEVALLDGSVMVIGGVSSNGRALASTEVYDPVANAWSAGKPMAHARSAFVAIRVSNGNIAVIGGYDSTGAPLASAEMYDWSSNQWSDLHPMADARAKFTATILGNANGDVLVAGGFGSTGKSLATAEILDPYARRFTPAGTMDVARRLQTATLLGDGRVLVAGGFGASGSLPIADAEIYDPAANGWTGVTSMATARDVAGAASLPNGDVIVLGGSAAGKRIASTELFDPIQGRWSGGPRLAVPRAYFALVVLGDRRLLVIGGDDDRGGPLASTEILTPPSG